MDWTYPVSLCTTGVLLDAKRMTARGYKVVNLPTELVERLDTLHGEGKKYRSRDAVVRDVVQCMLPLLERASA